MILTPLAVLLVLAGVALLFIKIPMTVEVDNPDYDPRGGTWNNPRRVKEERVTKFPTIIPIALFGLAALLVLLASIVAVPAKHVGVVSAFGAVNDETLSPGLSLVLPWEKVTDIDATWQSDEYKGKDAIVVQLGDGGEALIYVTNRWRVKASNADVTHSEYRSDDPTAELRDGMVSTQFKAAVNSAFGDFQPLNALSNISVEEASRARDIDFTPDYQEFADEIEKAFITKIDSLGGMVEVQDITISLIKFQGSTKKKIDQYNAEVGKTRIANQQEATNRAQSRANNALAESLSQDPNVLVARCFDLIDEGFKPSTNFQCWPGTAGQTSLAVK